MDLALQQQIQNAKPVELSDDANNIGYDYDELEAEQQKKDRIVKYILSLPTPPCSPEHHTATVEEQNAATVRKELFEIMNVNTKKLPRPTQYFADGLQSRDVSDLSRDMLSMRRLHLGGLISPVKKPTIRHVPARLPSSQRHPPRSMTVPGQQRRWAATQSKSTGYNAAETRHSTNKSPEIMLTMAPIVPNHRNGLNIMLLLPTSGSAGVESEMNGMADHVKSHEEITPDGTQKAYTIRQCSETSSIYADNLHDSDFNGIPPDQSRFKQVWMRIHDDETVGAARNEKQPSSRVPHSKRKVSAKAKASSGSASKAIRIASPEDEGPPIQQKVTFHEAVSSMLLKGKLSRKLMNNYVRVSSPPSSSDSKMGRRCATTSCATDLSNAGSNTSPMAREMYKKAHSKFESFLRPRVPTPHHPPHSTKVSLLSLGIQDIRNLDSEEVAARYKEYLEDHKRDKRRSRHRDKWSNAREADGNCTCCKLVDGFSRI
ncbi:uncharacterized protein V1513DRAFT_202326 [Lipomyces chichibuensis]|uniref:uncharacterized protein n=1 Tax=Lipomyces chichibuensis TaxID=1546026 RepID=UPI003343FC8A